MREQAKAFLQKPDDHVQGLNLINSTNLDYFQPQHQAEMINLKAQFFGALGDSDTGEEWCGRSEARQQVLVVHPPFAVYMEGQTRVSFQLPAPTSTLNPDHALQPTTCLARRWHCGRCAGRHGWRGASSAMPCMTSPKRHVG